jgi:hypothetical protein
MLLETLDMRTNDILIYSQNLFNFGENFKIIHKNAKVKKPQGISYFDVCNFVKDPFPKNLIIYRLLTNVNDLDAYSTKYGYFIKINGRMELVYFDPIYAIKDLRHLRFEFNPGHFRFKIQQMGLTSLTKWEGEPNFAEVYSFDLKAAEAQNQNDKIFADAIFAFDPNYFDENDDLENYKAQERLNKVDNNSLRNQQEGEKTNLVIQEDKEARPAKMNQPVAPDNLQASDLRDEIISLLKQALNIPAQEEKKHKPEMQAKTTSKQDEQLINSENGGAVNLLDLFKSTHKAEMLSSKEKESVILKFEER